MHYLIELRRLRRQLIGLNPEESRDEIVLLSYRPGLEEPGPEKSFDLSAAGLAQRWDAGVLDMEYCHGAGEKGALTVVRRPAV